MLNQNNFNSNSKKFNFNLKKTKKIFRTFMSDINNFEIPLLQSYEKNYIFDFSSDLIKKFSKYNNIVVIGMGGSILGTKAIYNFFRNKVKKKLFFFDNLDSNLHLQFKKVKNSCFIVVSKSGDTLETITNLNLFLSKFLLKNKLIIISEIKSSDLMNIADKYKAEVIEHKDFIGGRYSVLSEVGMFPAALLNLKVNKFKNLKKLIHNKFFVSSLIKSVTSIYTLNQQGVKNSVILNYDTRLSDLSLWHQQLIAESLGKSGKGITPIVSTCPKDHHSLLQLYLDGPKDKFFTFFNTSQKEYKSKVSQEIIPSDMKFLKNKNLEFIVKAQSSAVKNIFKLKKIPFREITFNKKNEAELGEIFTFFVLETILLSRLMNINPFDQPAVEEVKNETKKILS